MGKKFSIADYIGQAPPGTPEMQITMIPLQDIFANYRNFYSVDFQEVDLAESIKVSGLLTPLGVVPADGGKYKLISGHRRFKALRYLHDSEPDGRERWARVPCVVYATPEDADREELMIIHANAQRIKSGPEIAQEAKKTTEILTRMKERGVELPGRMRERVAEALKISSTRLARIEAIEHNLTYPGWQRKWKADKIPEAVAYRLSQLDYSQQMSTADYMIEKHIPDKDITVATVEAALRHPPLDNPGCSDPLAYEEDPVKVDRELVRRMDAMGYLSGMRFANRKDGMDQLKTTFRNWGHGSGKLDWEGEPKGVRFKKPVEWMLGWGAMYDALAANALDEAAARLDQPATEKEPRDTSSAAGAAPSPQGEGKGAVSNVDHLEPVWMSGEPPADGYYWCRMQCGRDTTVDVLRRKNGKWLLRLMNETAAAPVLAWWPLPPEDPTGELEGAE